MGNGKKVWGMCMDIWERVRESKGNRWDEGKGWRK